MQCATVTIFQKTTLCARTHTKDWRRSAAPVRRRQPLGGNIEHLCRQRAVRSVLGHHASQGRGRKHEILLGASRDCGRQLQQRDILQQLAKLQAGAEASGNGNGLRGLRVRKENDIAQVLDGQHAALCTTTRNRNEIRGGITVDD